MSYDPKHVKEAMGRLALRRAERKARLASFKAQCRQRLPQLAALDSAIGQSVTKAIAAALQRGVDPTAAVEAARRGNLALQAQRRELLERAGIDPAQLS